MRHRPLAVKNPAMDPNVLQQQNLRATAFFLLLVSTLLFSATIHAEEDDAKRKAYDAKLKSDRANAEARMNVDKATSEDQRRSAKKHLDDMKSKQEQKQNLAEFKEKTLTNLSSIKELYAKAEDAFKNKRMKEAGDLYSSVALANVAGSEEMAETSRGRLVEFEDQAKAQLKAADDLDLKREYVKEVEILSAINKEFPRTEAHKTAVRRLITLKSRPEIAGYVELAQAESFESDGKLTDAVEHYGKISTNPRYENSIPALKAKRKLEELNRDDGTREKIKTEFNSKADKDAPVLLASAKNFVSNRMPKQAIEKLQTVVDKYPETKYAEEARKQIDELKQEEPKK